MLDLLGAAKRDGGEVYAALFELNDPELLHPTPKTFGRSGLGRHRFSALEQVNRFAFLREPKRDARADVQRWLRFEWAHLQH